MRRQSYGMADSGSRADLTVRWIFLSAIMLFLFIYIAPLGIRPLMIPDETRYAEIPREMLQSGDWVVPRLNGLRYFEKPVLGYWIKAASMSLFGENQFAARLPLALAAGLTALMLFFLARRFIGGVSAAILTVSVYLTSLEVFLLGVINILDGFLTLFLTGTLVLFFLADREPRIWKRRNLLALSGIFCGLAFLTKGLLGVAIPVIVVTPYLVWQRRPGDLLRLPWIPLTAACLVSLPWAMAISIREPDFWRYFILVEHFQRFNSDLAQHDDVVYYFVPIMLAGAFPWTALLPASFSGLKTIRPFDPLLRFAICWLVFPFLLLSASHGKLATYILPCFPPLAILTAAGLLGYFKNRGDKAFRLGAGFLAGFTGLLSALLVFVQIAGLPITSIYGEGETWKWMTTSAVLMGAALLFYFSTRSGIPGKRLIMFSFAPCLILGTAHFMVPDSASQAKAPGRFLMKYAQDIGEETTLVSEGALAPAICWYYRRSDVRLLDDEGGELRYGLGYADAEERTVNLEQFKELVREAPGAGRVVLIVRPYIYEAWRKILPEPIREEGDGAFVFAQF